MYDLLQKVCNEHKPEATCLPMSTTSWKVWIRTPSNDEAQEIIDAALRSNEHEGCQKRRENTCDNQMAADHCIRVR